MGRESGINIWSLRLTVLAELDEIISLLEAQIPANPQSPKNQRLKKRVERLMAKYFRDLADAFPYQKLEGIYNKNVKESIGSDTKGMLDPLLGAFDDTLQAEVEGQLAEIYLSGQAEVITWGKTKGGVPIAFEGPPISQAVDWAKKQGATLVTQMDTETKRRLALQISNGIQNKRGVPGLARDIRQSFADMTRFRSQLIARTETSFALSSASLETMSAMGIEGKEWVTVGDDRVSEECEMNEGEGIIPVGQAFSGGTMAPPQHPDCRCAVSPARLPESEGGLGEEGSNNVNYWQFADSSPRGPSYIDMRNPATAAGKSFTRTLSKMPDFQGTTYRGVVLDDAEIQRLVSAKGYKMRLHSSASTDIDVAKQFMSAEGVADPSKKSVLLELKGKGKNINSFLSEELQGTKEIVMEAGTNYKFSGISQEGAFIRIILEEVK